MSRASFPLKRKAHKSSWWAALLILAVALIAAVSFAQAHTSLARQTERIVNSVASSNTVYLPIVENTSAFTPNEDTTLPGGTYEFADFNIPAGVTVTITGTVTIGVRGDTHITGTLTGDCHGIELLGQGSLTITGAVDNRCAAAADNPGDLFLYTDGGTLQIGTADTPAQLDTDGNLDVGNAPGIEEWEFDVLPDQRSDTALPPICATWADTLWDSVITTTVPITVAFYGDGADPDGGPVTYAWDFDDGGNATERDPLHAFDSWGTYDITLTVTDDDSQTCQAGMRIVLDDGDANAPDAPGVWAAPLDLVVEAGQDALFNSDAADPQDDDLTYQWDFGSGVTSTLSHPTQTFATAGRYPVTLTVTDAGSFTSTATASIYVYEASVGKANLVAALADTCAAPTFNAAVNKGQAGTYGSGNGKNGKTARFRGRGDVFLGGATSLNAQDGGDGADKNGAGSIIAGRGGRGGSLNIWVNGSLTVCGGASFSAGDGGDGGNATSDTPAPRRAYARGGSGGPAARSLRIAATQGVTFAGAVTIDPGSGGDGGMGTATGGNGADACPVGKEGASAIGVGGNGGKASKKAIVVGNVTGAGNITVTGGMGGDGGKGDATGGDGGNAICADTATGGQGKDARATGGKGGDARLNNAATGMVFAADAFTAGKGGDAEAWGGYGGEAVATAAGCGSNADATGGAAGIGRAIGGKGGRGRTSGNGGNVEAWGGHGGDATAIGGDCDICGQPGGNATATGAVGAESYARYGRKGGSGAADGTALSDAGDGGDATAIGGKGGDCPICPGSGGDGGQADATGGDGGDAKGNDTKIGGDGGDANATGGKGGFGADCCKIPGGNGGAGGDAISTAGGAGSPGGSDGGNGVKGGDGGDAGDGLPPGLKGPGGTGTGTPVDIPDGVDGADGVIWDICAIWYIYHSSIPDGIIAPGTVIPLDTYITTSITTTPTGIVPLHFMEQADLGYPPYYFKDGDILQVQGGLQYDLLPILDVFPVIMADVTLLHICQNPGCIQVIGFVDGNQVSVAQNELVWTGGDPVLEQIILPTPPMSGTYYDQFHIVLLEPTAGFAFDHWWIIIVDP